MQSIPQQVTVKELSLILNVKEDTVQKLYKTNQLPGTYEKRHLYFDFEAILEHFQKLEGGAA
jgi:hypothetical protein